MSTWSTDSGAMVADRADVSPTSTETDRLGPEPDRSRRSHRPKRPIRARALENCRWGRHRGSGPARPDRPLSYREAVHEPHGTDDLAGAVIGVVGAGTMGAGIAQVALEAGHEVVLYDVDEAALETGVERVRVGLGRRAAKLELDADSIDEWVDGRLANLRTAVTLDAVAAAADVAIEAAIEDLDLKRTIFGALDREAPPDALLATNTSALSVAVDRRRDQPAGARARAPFLQPGPVDAAGRGGSRATDGRRFGAASGRADGALGQDAGRGRGLTGVHRQSRQPAVHARSAGDARSRGGEHPGDRCRGSLGGLSDGPVRADGPHRRRRQPGRGPRDPRGVRGPRRPAGGSVPAVGIAGAPGRGGAAGTQDWRRLLHIRRPAWPSSWPPTTLDPKLRDRIVERIELAIVNEAYRARDEGVAGEADIDRALRLGAGHPAGPFERWAERGGAAAIRDRLANHGDQGPRFVPAPGLNDGPV